MLSYEGFFSQASFRWSLCKVPAVGGSVINAMFLAKAMFTFKPFDEEPRINGIRVLSVEEALADIAKIPYPHERKPSENRFSIDDLINLDPEKGVFYSEERDKKRKSIGVAVALEKALTAVGEEGIVASLPYLIAGKARADKEKNYLWRNWFTALSEEHVGIDKKGTAYVVTLHGGGLLTPQRIFQAYDEGLTKQGAAKLKPEEFDDLLQGNLPSGEKITLHEVEDVEKSRIPHPFGRYAIIMDLKTAKATKSGYFKKEEFMENPLVWARVGTLGYLEDYFEKAKYVDGTVGNFLWLAKINANQPQSRLLFVSNSLNCLGDNELNVGSGRFAGVGAGGTVREA